MEEYQNVAVRMIGGDSRPYNSSHLPTAEMLQVAKTRLDGFDLVGLNEAFYTTVKLTFAFMGWDIPALESQRLIGGPDKKVDCSYGQKTFCHWMAKPNGNRKATEKRPDYKMVCHKCIFREDFTKICIQRILTYWSAVAHTIEPP
jgi:hypothetical protein